MSYDERLEFRALEELRAVVRGVSDELAGWRRRAQRAEAALGVEPDAITQRERVIELEANGRILDQRLAAARARVEELMKRLQFLEEQMAIEGPAR